MTERAATPAAPVRESRPAAAVRNGFAIVDILVTTISAVVTVLLWIGLALLSMVGAGASWRADELFGLLVTLPFVLLEITVVGSALAALAHINRWRGRWLLQTIAFAPTGSVALWLWLTVGAAHR